MSTVSEGDVSAFLIELQDLLKKYEACISWTCGPSSDTHGIYDDVITVDMFGKEVFRSDHGILDADTLERL